MDLRRIVEEVEERKRLDLAMAPPPSTRAPSTGKGVTGSILENVRHRMLREDPTADVSAFEDLLEPARSTPPPAAPGARIKGESAAATIAREASAAEHHGAVARSSTRVRASRDDFLARYLVMSEEFEKRYKAKGWTNLVRKKCSSDLRK